MGDRALALLSKEERGEVCGHESTRAFLKKEFRRHRLRPCRTRLEV